MSVFRGAAWVQPFTFKNKITGLPIDISAWQFRGEFRARRGGDVLVTLTTANSGFSLIDGPNGRVEIRLTDTQSALLPLGRPVFDVMRTDNDLSPIYLFGGTVRVKDL